MSGPTEVVWLGVYLFRQLEDPLPLRKQSFCLRYAKNGGHSDRQLVCSQYTSFEMGDPALERLNVFNCC